MSALPEKRRRAAKRLALTGAAATSAAALAIGVGAPVADAATNVTNAPTAGALISVLPLLGIEGVSAPLGIDYINLVPTHATTDNLYRAMNATLSIPTGSGGNVCLAASTAQCRFTPVISTGGGAFGAMGATNGLIASALGDTPSGQNPLNTGTTSQAVLAINNPLRPNGGIRCTVP